MRTPFGHVPDALVQRSMADSHEYLQSRLSRRSVLQGAAVGVGALFAGPVLWRQTARAGALPLGRHLTLGADPARQMAVSWMTTGPVAQPAVDLGLDTGYGSVIEAETRTVPGTDTHYHHAVLDGLDPATAYHYRVTHDGAESDDAILRTAPDGQEPFTFTAFGDQGLGDAGVATTNRVAEIQPAFHLHAGDISYAYDTGLGVSLNEELDHTDMAVWDDWLRMMSQAAATTPWMPAVGNHEMEPGFGPQGYDGFLGRFAMPGSGPVPVVYDFRYGNLAVISLDGNDASSQLIANRGYTDGEQDRWLAERLAAWRADPAVDFVVVQFHNCAYCTNTTHGSDGGIREAWVGLFDEHQVDLVINGHNHCYERTHPLRGGSVTTELLDGGEVRPAEHGTVYMTVGGGGRHLYEEFDTEDAVFNEPEPHRGTEGPVDWSATRLIDFCLVAVDVTPATGGGQATMRVRSLTAEGDDIESFTIARESAAPATTVPPDRAADAPAGPAGDNGSDDGGISPLTIAAVGGAVGVGAGVAVAAARSRRNAGSADAAGEHSAGESASTDDTEDVPS
jgi:hypothetical protein